MGRATEERWTFGFWGRSRSSKGTCRYRLGSRASALLVALLLQQNESLSRERLVDLVWGESPPRTVNAAVYNGIAHLRDSLGPERIVGDVGGYRLVVGETELDRD